MTRLRRHPCRPRQSCARRGHRGLWRPTACKALEACPEETSGNQWLTAVLGAVAVVLAAVVYSGKEKKPLISLEE